MIFVLSDAFLALNEEELSLYVPAIENLITAHAHGWHIFAPGREVGRLLADRNDLSGHKRDVLRYHILRRSAELSGQARSVSRFVYCVPDGYNNLDVDERCLVVPLSLFLDM